jgi:pimeloyl-ACP methyl ester carboxylesterase
MRVGVNGTRIWFDVEGAGLVPDGRRMRHRPTLVLLHGGPGFDHSDFKPSHSALIDTAQLLYVDHRGNGRSDYSDPAFWTLAQWADDLRALFDLLEIENPIVLGLSFGGFVAQSLGVRHPRSVGKLILSSTVARFRKDRAIAAFGEMFSAQAREVADAFWNDPADEEKVQKYLDVCLPLYNPTPGDADAAARSTFNPAMLAHFYGRGGEGHRFDFRPRLTNISCPTLVLAGALDPVSTMADAEDMVASLPAQHVRFKRFAGCGHGVHRDAPDQYFALLREFIAT